MRQSGAADTWVCRRPATGQLACSCRRAAWARGWQNPLSCQSPSPSAGQAAGCIFRAQVCLPPPPRHLTAPRCSWLQSRPCSFPLLAVELDAAHIRPAVQKVPRGIFFPSPRTAAPGPGCVNTAKYHLMAADTRGLYLPGKDHVANILNNSLRNVGPGYCRIHFIIRALGCTLLIILSNNLRSTVSV